ncbi:MAG: hypothetical protein LBI87_02535 [Candidatus Accumulibacter sp.]|jgi:hypothetical protein|nr:hypothetical protein [Accumulibacter sp.]
MEFPNAVEKTTARLLSTHGFAVGHLSQKGGFSRGAAFTQTGIPDSSQTHWIAGVSPVLFAFFCGRDRQRSIFDGRTGFSRSRE